MRCCPNPRAGFRKSREVSRARQTQNVGDAVEAGLLALAPARRGNRAMREDRTIFRDVRQHQALARSGEDHIVVADHRAASQRSKADRALGSWSRLAVAAAHGMAFEGDAAAFGGFAAKPERGARGGIDLAVVMHLDD